MGEKPVFLSAALSTGQENITSVCVKVLASILFSSAESVMTVKRSSPGKGGTLQHAIFGSPSKTSAVNPSFLNAAFSARTAEWPGTAGMKAAGGRLSATGVRDQICQVSSG